VSDRAILARARSEGRVIVTQDLDFSALLALSGESAPSVIQLRLERAWPDLVSRRRIDVMPSLREELERGAIASVDEHQLRIRILPVGD